MSAAWCYILKILFHAQTDNNVLCQAPPIRYTSGVAIWFMGLHIVLISIIAFPRKSCWDSILVVVVVFQCVACEEIRNLFSSLSIAIHIFSFLRVTSMQIKRILHYCQMRLSSDHMGNASRSSATTYRMLRKVLSYILDFSVRIQTTFSLSFGRDIQVISQWVIVAERNTVFLPATMSRGKAGETKKYLQPSCGRHPWIRTYFRSHHESNMILY